MTRKSDEEKVIEHAIVLAKSALPIVMKKLGPPLKAMREFLDVPEVEVDLDDRKVKRAVREFAPLADIRNICLAPGDRTALDPLCVLDEQTCTELMYASTQGVITWWLFELRAAAAKTGKLDLAALNDAWLPHESLTGRNKKTAQAQTIEAMTDILRDLKRETGTKKRLPQDAIAILRIEGIKLENA